ncbi:YidB family protein [Enterobacter ludwigii]|uniref:YidB family protein n=1 Tax=Enterobacter ludwigii TaxID=299767 RepID=UPI001F154426|nr:YidB family protein [Enterobacter ludwigii]MDZ5700488.1 YidB family protein [Enterobacter ludwigii]
MGLLDQIGSLASGQGGKTEQLQAIMTWIEQQGGIQGILEKFRNGGLGGVVESWLSQQSNQSVNSEQITSVFGSPALQDLGAKLGVDSQTASTLIAEYLPKIVDGLSPQGEAPAQGDLMSAGLNLLKGKFLS